MDALPQVGQKYQHKKWGQIIVAEVRKRGRGWQVWSVEAGREFFEPPQCERLKDFQKATA